MTPLAYFGIESTGVTVVIDLLIVFGVLLYMALVYWTYVDARRRIVDPMLVGSATAVSLFPFVGTLLYLIVRPPETLEDARERDLDVETTRLQLHQLESGLCPHCDYPVELDYVRCPSCLRRLKERCKSCSRPLDRAWTICPYCEAEVSSRGGSTRRDSSRRPARPRPALERELASEKTTAAEDGHDASSAPESAAGQRRRAAASGEELEPESGERAPAPRQRTERSRPTGAPRPGSAY